MERPPVSYEAFLALWEENFAQSTGGDPFQAYTFSVEETEDEALDAFADQLNGLRVITIDWKKVATSSEPIPANSVDVMVYYRYGALRQSPPPTLAIPEGVRCVFIIESGAEVMPTMPDSVEVAVYEGCWAISTLDALPPRLRALHVQTDTGVNIPDLTLRLPSGLRSLGLAFMESVYIQGPMPPRLKSVTLNEVTMSYADSPLPPSLTHYESDGQPTGLELSCGPNLKVLELNGGLIPVFAKEVANLEEYEAVCLGLRKQKPAKR